MGAGAGWRQYTQETLASSTVQSYLQDQTVMQFDSNSAMDAQFPGSARAAGQLTFMRDANRHYAQYASGARFPFARFLGALSAWPTDASVSRGDFFYSIPHQCHMVAGASAIGWNQVEVPSVNGLAGRTALTNAVTAAGMTLTDGFRVFAYGLERVYVWDRANWRLLGGKPGTEFTGGGAGTVQSGWTAGVAIVRHLGNGMASVYLELTRNAGAGTINVAGKGDVANVAMFQLRSGYEPMQPTTMVSGWAGRVATGQLPASSGMVYLTAVAGTGDIVTDDVLSFGATYALANAAGLGE